MSIADFAYCFPDRTRSASNMCILSDQCSKATRLAKRPTESMRTTWTNVVKKKTDLHKHAIKSKESSSNGNGMEQEPRATATKCKDTRKQKK